MKNIVLILVIVLIGCGSKTKTTKKDTKEIYSSEQMDKIDIDLKKAELTEENERIIESKILEKREEDVFEISFIPINNDKPIIVNGNSYLNARIVQSKKSIKKEKQGMKNSFEKNKKDSSFVDLKKDSISFAGKNKIIVNKEQSHLERDNTRLWWLLLLLIPLYFWIRYVYL